MCSVAADFLTTNEGDARELGDEDDENYFLEEIRVEDLAVELGVDSSMMAAYSDDTLGRLKVRCCFVPGSGRRRVCPVYWSPKKRYRTKLFSCSVLDRCLIRHSDLDVSAHATHAQRRIGRPLVQSRRRSTWCQR